MLAEITLIGRLGRDPVSKTTRGGETFATMSLGCEVGKERVTQWFDVVAFGKVGENCLKYLAKGRQVYIKGIPSVRAYAGRDGSPKASLNVRAFSVKFLGNKNDTSTNETRSSPSGFEGSPDYAQSFDDEDIPF